MSPAGELLHSSEAISHIDYVGFDTCVYPQIQSVAKEAPKAVDKVKLTASSLSVA